MTFEDSIHKVTLSGSEISSILYALEGWIQANDEYEEGGDLALDIDNVFEALQEVADSWEGEFAEPKVIQSQELEGDISTVRDSDYIKCESNNKNNATYNEVDYVEQCITEGNDYADCVDTLVDKMKGVNDNYYRIDGY